MSQVRYVLGFAADCIACSRIARRIEQLSDGIITVQPLQSPLVKAWRTQMPGDDTSSIPILFETKNDSVRGYTGWGMSWRLLQLLGPKKGWQIVWAIGDFASSDQSVDLANGGRRRFFRSLLAGISLTILLSTGKKSFLTANAQTSTSDPIAITQADDATASSVVAGADQDSRVLQLRGYLSSQGFTVKSEPQVYVAAQNSQQLRTFYVQEYNGSDSGTIGNLYYGIESNSTTWAHAIVHTAEGDIYGLEIIDGNVQRIRASATTPVSSNIRVTASARTFHPQPPARTSSPSTSSTQDFSPTPGEPQCTICKYLCRGPLCIIGSRIACGGICGSDTGCHTICEGIFFLICGRCTAGCEALGWCPSPRGNCAIDYDVQYQIVAQAFGTIIDTVRLRGPVFLKVNVVGQFINWYVSYDSGKIYGLLSSAQKGDNATILSVTPVFGQICPQDNPNS